jgi:signal transduction histidine kinase
VVELPNGTVVELPNGSVRGRPMTVKKLQGSGLSTRRSRLVVADRERLILNRAHAIEHAMSELHQLYERAKQVCEEIKKELGYDFVAVQLVDLGEQTIQTMHGSGLSGDWYKIAKHSLEGDSKFLDIQAYVALATPPVMEIITGWDERFDRFIYKKFGHENYVRAFVPLIVRRHDQNGSLIEADPRQFRFEAAGADRPTATLIIPQFEQVGVIPPYEVIGTIEAGFDNSRLYLDEVRTFSQESAQILFQAACKHGYALYKSTLRHVLEVITRSALGVARADYANMHFPLDPHRNTYNVWAGPTLSRSVKPRPGGLAEKAIAAARPFFLSGKSLAEFNPEAYSVGIHAMAAYPLVISEGPASALQRNITEEKKGVLYVAFKKEHEFTRDEIDGLQLFTNLAQDAILHAMHSMDTIQAARQLANLHEISRSLADEADHEYLLESIAGHSLNVLAADLVVIYEYDHAQQLFLSKPAAAGRRETRSGEPGAPDYTPPSRLIAKSVHYARCPEELVMLYADAATEAACRCFIEREKLLTGAAVPLWFGGEAVGIIFVNYRRDHNFSKYELSIIETLGSTAAVAIQYRRLLREREQAVLAVTHQLRNSLSGMRLKILQTKEQEAQIADQLGSLDAWNEALFVSLTRDDGEPVAPEPDDIDIPVEVRWIWELVKSAREGCDLRLRIMLDSDSRVTRINRAILRNVLYSLFDNARKYADPSSELLVEWSVRTNLIKVRSIGTPISPDECEKVFNKFSQGREVARKKAPGGGVGLGLWVTRKVLKLAGGDIRLELDLENPRTTTFVVRLPDEA